MVKFDSQSKQHWGRTEFISELISMSRNRRHFSEKLKKKEKHVSKKSTDFPSKVFGMINSFLTSLFYDLFI